METNNSFQSSWTLADSLIMEISNHLRTGRNYWLHGNLEKYYWEFEAVVRVIRGMIDPTESAAALKKEEEILNIITSEHKSKDAITKLSKNLKEYDAMVMTFLHTHKLDVPPKRDRTVMIA